jgi:hypothetical protein
MSTILLVGVGAVGARAGRQLVDTPGVSRVLVTGRTPEGAERVARLLGARAAAHAAGSGDLDGVDAVAVAAPPGVASTVVRDAVATGRPVAVVADGESSVAALLAFDARAQAAGSAVVAGCGLAPGLVEVLARHAADGMDRADEAHVARVGVAGPACLDALRGVHQEPALEWHDGSWRRERRRGAQLVWFPDPVGARECRLVASGVGLLRDALPDLRYATVRMGEPPERRGPIARLGVRRDGEPWGAARVEVWGWRGSARDVVVYGVIEDPAVAAGVVLAVTTARLAGAVPEIGLRTEPVGARGLGALVEPASFLAELARRGVRTAVFEGVPA